MDMKLLCLITTAIYVREWRLVLWQCLACRTSVGCNRTDK